MTTQAIEVGVKPAIVPRAVGRPRLDADRPQPDVIRRMVGVVFLVLLVLGLCGMATTADGAGAGATQPEGPAPGLDL
jgi:hypothetical protein